MPRMVGHPISPSPINQYDFLIFRPRTTYEDRSDIEEWGCANRLKQSWNDWPLSEAKDPALHMTDPERYFVIPTHRLRDVGTTIHEYDEHFWRNGHSLQMIVNGWRCYGPICFSHSAIRR